MLIFSGLIFADNIEVLNQTEDAVTLRFTIPDYTISQVRKEGQLFNVIECKEAISSSEEGSPILPYFTEVIGLPADGQMHISILNSQKEYSDNMRIIPQEMITPVDESYEKSFYIDNAVYSSRKYIPENIVSDEGTALYRNWNFGTIRINPFRFNPLSGRLEIINSMDIQINISGTKTVPHSMRSSNIPGMEMVSELAVNGNISRNWVNPIAQTSQSDNNTRSMNRSNDIEEIQILVSSDGIYKIYYRDLVDSLVIRENFTGSSVFDWDNIDPRYLELYDEDGIVPIHFPGEIDGHFSRGEYFEFYGKFHRGETCYYDDYTCENVYTLRLVPYYGARMAVENGGLQVTNPSDYISPRAYRQKVHFEKQLQFQKLGYNRFNNREDRYFWASITAPHLLTIPFNLQYPYEAGTRYFDAKVVLFGATHNTLDHPDHNAVVRMNSELIGDQEWYLQYEEVFENDDYLPNTSLNHGSNNLYISLPGVEGVAQEQVLLDYFELDYWRMYKTDEDFIEFSKPSNRSTGLYQFELQYFSSEDVSVYKIGSSIMENVEIIPAENDTVFEVRFQDDVLSDDIMYYAVSESNKKSPIKVRFNYPSNLKSEQNYANYVIVTGTQFVDCDGTTLLHNLWEEYDVNVYGHNIEVEVVDVQDIYDEFNSGIESADAIKDFFSYVFNNWNDAQTLGYSLFTHALLLGEGITEQLDNSINRKYDIVPPILVWTEKQGATASDNKYACVIGSDNVPDFSIGRLNVYTEEQVEAVARKTLRYITEPQTQQLWTNHVVLCAGGKSDDTHDLFSRQSESLRKGFIDASFDVSRVYLKTLTVPNVYGGNTSNLLEDINDGAFFVQFMGHGGGQTWDDNDLLNIQHIETFTNTAYPFVSSMSCYGSAFETPGLGSMGEALTVHSNGGAIAHVGFAGLGYEIGDEYFSRYLFDALFYRNLGNVGSIVDFAKTKITLKRLVSSPSLGQGCILHGDPMIKFILPERDIQVNVSDFAPEEGDTIRISATFPSDVVGARVNVCSDDEIPLRDFYEVSTPGGILIYDYVVPANFNENNYLREIRVLGYSHNMLYSGYSEFFVGDDAVFDSRVEPPTFSVYDSLYISTQVALENGFQEFTVITEYDSIYTQNDTTVVIMNNLEEVNMVYSAEDGRYRSERPLRKLRYDTEMKYYFHIVKSNGTQSDYRNEDRIFEINCPDLIILSVQVIEENEKPALKVQMKNQGKLASEQTTMRLLIYNNDGWQEMNFTDIPSLQVNEIYIRTIDLSGITTEGTIIVMINPDETFIETGYQENTKQLTFDMNLFTVDENGTVVLSPDGNLNCTIPDGIFDRVAMGSVSRRDLYTPVNQDDIGSNVLGGDNSAAAYEIFMIDEDFYADSLKTIPNNGSISLSFSINPADSLTALAIADNQLAVYRWEEDFEKWIFQGGLISRDKTRITKEITKFGTYAVMINKDRERPIVKANVENQEFTHGGYISGTGIISFVLSDGNGIDIFDNQIRMYLNGEKIDKSDYTIAASKGNLTHIPLKYKLDLEKGEYNLIIDCQDVNGNFSEHKIQFIVNNHFDIINVGNYPNPVITKTYESDNSGRTRFTYVLTDDADYVSIRIYTVSGRLVKSFNDLNSSVGYHEFPRTIRGWDCRDELGRELANGVYFYRITARKGGKTIKKTEKMAILK